jgi:hypothetical protein
MLLPPREALEALKESPKLLASLDKAIKWTKGRTTFEQVIDGVVSGKLIVWTKNNAVIVGEILNFTPTCRWLSLRFGAGNLSDLKAMIDEPKEFARALGLQGIQAGGRKAWSRFCREFGFRPTEVFYEWEPLDG